MSRYTCLLFLTNLCTRARLVKEAKKKRDDDDDKDTKNAKEKKVKKVKTAPTKTGDKDFKAAAKRTSTTTASSSKGSDVRGKVVKARNGVAIQFSPENIQQMLQHLSITFWKDIRHNVDVAYGIAV